MPIKLRAHRALIAAGSLAVIALVIGLGVTLQSPSAPPRVAAVAAPAMPQKAPPAATNALPTDPILDLFQPSDASLQQQLSTTQLTQQIENAMVVSYTLVHCHLLSQSDYAATFNALVVYASRSHLAPDAAQAEAKVRAIADAAGASYALVYSNANCADPSLIEKAAALTQWREQIVK